MEPKCENCYYFLEITDDNNIEHDYYCLGDNYPYATPADIKGCRFWDKNVCFKEKGGTKMIIKDGLTWI